MAEHVVSTISTIRDLLDEGFSLHGVDSTDDHLVLDLFDGTTVRKMRLSPDAVREAVRAGLLDELASSAGRSPVWTGVELRA